MMADVYRRYAGECLLLLEAVTDPEARASFRSMALAWNSLADQAERNRKLAAGESPAADGPAHVAPTKEGDEE
jgi:hypothetical protein